MQFKISLVFCVFSPLTRSVNALSMELLDCQFWISILGLGFHTGGFTVAFGHGHPLVINIYIWVHLLGVKDHRMVWELDETGHYKPQLSLRWGTPATISLRYLMRSKGERAGDFE
jgi:hypothetical protein